MSVNTQNSNAKWPEIKTEIRKNWDKVPEADLEVTKGDFKSIAGLLQKNYGDTVDSYSKKLSEIFKNFGEVKATSAEASVAKK